MPDSLEMLLDWDRLSIQVGLDGVIYAIFATTGTALFIVRFAMLALGVGGDDEFDADMEHGSGLQLFSLLSVTAFLMGAGWMGLTARIDWDFGPTAAACLAGGFGFSLTVLASVLLAGMHRLRRQVTYEPESAIGHTGTVYMAIPAKGIGTGQVRVSVSGRSMILRAASNGAAIEAFVDIRVVGVRDDNLLLVERL